MSFLVGPITGGLVAGAVYYSFSRAFETRTRDLQGKLHQLSTDLQEPTTPAPPPASARIVYSPFREMLKERWNREVAAGVRAVENWDPQVQWRDAQELGQKLWEKVQGGLSSSPSSTSSSSSS